MKGAGGKTLKLEGRFQKIINIRSLAGLRQLLAIVTTHVLEILPIKNLVRKFEQQKSLSISNEQALVVMIDHFIELSEFEGELRYLIFELVDFVRYFGGKTVRE